MNKESNAITLFLLQTCLYCSCKYNNIFAYRATTTVICFGYLPQFDTKLHFICKSCVAISIFNQTSFRLWNNNTNKADHVFECCNKFSHLKFYIAMGSTLFSRLNVTCLQVFPFVICCTLRGTMQNVLQELHHDLISQRRC